MLKTALRIYIQHERVVNDLCRSSKQVPGAAIERQESKEQLVSANRVEQIERQENKEQLMSTNQVEQIELREQDHEGVGDVPSPIERIGQVRVNTIPNYVDGLEQKRGWES